MTQTAEHVTLTGIKYPILQQLSSYVVEDSIPPT